MPVLYISCPSSFSTPSHILQLRKVPESILIRKISFFAEKKPKLELAYGKTVDLAQ